MLFLLGGFVVTGGQVLGIIIGNGPFVEFFGTTVTDIACTVAGIAGILAFVLLYTSEGKAESEQLEERAH